MMKELWSRQGGYREVLSTAFPLILGTSAWTLQQFVDRVFLTWYSPAAIAASMPAGILNFTFVSLFMGTVSYVTTFIHRGSFHSYIRALRSHHFQVHRPHP